MPDLPDCNFKDYSGSRRFEDAYTVPIKGKTRGVAPAVVLIDPRFGHNVGNAMRACSCWGVDQLWWTGDRVMLDLAGGERLPREERMKGYRSVQLYQHERPLDFFENATPVAVELLPGSENLIEFDHPDNAVYVFGPEDGNVESEVRRRCHRFVQIPTKHCLNLAAAVNIVLYDRMCKQQLAHPEGPARPQDILAEPRGSGAG